MDFFLTSGRGIVVTTPTPTATVNAYLFMKNVVFRVINSAFKKNSPAFQYLDGLKKDGSALQRIYIPKLLESIKSEDPESFEAYQKGIAKFHPRLILNMLEDPRDSDKANKLRRSCQQYLDVDMEHLGVVYRDDLQDIALRSRLPILVYKPQSVLSQAIFRIADKLIQDKDDDLPVAFEELDETYQTAEIEASVDFEAKMDYIEELLQVGALSMGDLVETIKTQQLEINQLKKENQFLKSRLVKKHDGSIGSEKVDMAAKKSELHGKLDILIETSGLEAFLTFQPAGETLQFDTSDLIKFLQEHGVKEGYSPQNLEKILKQLEKAREAAKIPIAKGSPPEQPEPEKAVWQPLPIPDALKADGERAVADLSAPVITTEKVEKIKKEKIVLKKSPLPFIPPKEEKVTVIEKVVSQERVYVDSALEGLGYVTPETKIAVVEPMKNGIPGRTVSGDVIPANALADPYVYAGNGVEKRKGELVATAEGFIRWGKNWAEVISFKPHVWEVSLSPDRSTCIIAFTPGDKKAQIPNGEEIAKAAEALPYPKELLLSPEEIGNLLHDILVQGVPVKSVPLSAARNASFEIKVSEDKLKATLNLKKGRGTGKPLSLKEVGAAIKAGNFKGLNFEKIKTDIMEFYKSEAQELTDYLLAEGKAPTRGPDRKIECSVKFFDPKTLDKMKQTAAEFPAGLDKIPSLAGFPIDTATEMGFVEKEQRVLVLSPPVMGQPGTDVYGSALPGTAGADPEILIRENLDRKQNVVIAMIDGVFEQRSQEGRIEMRVRPHKDGEVKVAVSANKMEGYISLFPHEGTGRPLGMPEVQEAISKAGITKGVRQEVLDKAFDLTREGKNVADLVFAVGKQPQEGRGSRLKFLVHVAEGGQVTIKNNGTADYKNRDNITSVQEGVRIAEVLPPEAAAEDGWDLTGKVLPTKGETNLDLEIGGNVRETTEEGKKFLVAAKSGELLYDKKKIDIQDAHVIKGNVDFSSGNVKFPGSVSVSGSVLAGFYILSGGDIKINEGIEAALLSADGSILIQQGIKGGGKAVLRAKKNIFASFIEQAVLLSVGDIKVKNHCLRSMIKCNGKMELISEKGNIIGGVVKSRMGIEASSIGSEIGVKTEISFGQDYLIADQIELEEKEIKKLSAASMKIDQMMRESEKKADRKRLDMLRTEKLKTLKLVEKRSLRLFTLREKFEEHFPAEIKVRGTLHAGVVIESHGRYHEVTKEKKGIKIVFNSETGRIEEQPLQKGGKQ